MIKNAVLFRMSNTAILNLQSLEEALLKQTFTECSPTQELSFGWVPPRGEEHGALVETINGHWIIKMMVESKKVPTDIVTRKLAEACDKIELESGRKPGKKQQRDLKEELKFGLLPSVLPKRHTILAWLDNKASILVVDASSVGKCDLLIRSGQGHGWHQLHTNLHKTEPFHWHV